jgi:hypothetical protein
MTLRFSPVRLSQAYDSRGITTTRKHHHVEPSLDRSGRDKARLAVIAARVRFDSRLGPFEGHRPLHGNAMLAPVCGVLRRIEFELQHLL